MPISRDEPERRRAESSHSSAEVLAHLNAIVDQSTDPSP
jgi:hypothetical protein